MTTADVIEGEVVSREIVPATPAAPPAALFSGATPKDVVAEMRAYAEALKDVIETAIGSDDKPLVMTLPGRPGKYVRFEGWTTLGAMLKVFPIAEWTEDIVRDGEVIGVKARVLAKTMAGATVGAAEAICSKDEKRWASADHYALESMAQTRAGSKALRMPLGFVMTLAGYDATPAEEMTFAQESESRAERVRDVNAGHQERVAARNAAKTPKASPAAKPDIQSPLCPEHQIECEYVPGGTSAKTGKDYRAFYSCPKRDCTAGKGYDGKPNGKRFSIDSLAWQDILSQQANENAPREEYDADDVPSE